nr:helix-turn-helix domain-containing protein [Lederbergia citrea]
MEVTKVKTCPLAYYKKKSCKSSEWGHFEFHSHKEFEIYLFHSGSCNYLINNTVYHMHPGDIILLNGLTLHRANPMPTEPYVRSVVHFSPEVMNASISALEFPELLHPFSEFNNCLFRNVEKPLLNRIETLIEKIEHLYSRENIVKVIDKDLTKSNRLIEAKMQTLIIQLLFQIYELSQTENKKYIHADTEKELHVNRITKWIEQHYQEDISLDDIAKNLCISKYYLSHIFKEVTGGTVMKYLMGCRVNRAKILLETEPKKLVLDIALESGFKHNSHFSRYFQQEVGMTPSDYRKRYYNPDPIYHTKYEDRTVYLNN